MMVQQCENEDEFILERKEPYADRHFFADEELDHNKPATDE
jgi:hypothetical protein